MNANGIISRPGLSSEFLARHNVRHVEAQQAAALIGYEASGTWIPYPGLHSSELIVNNRPFGRVRLDSPNGAKYLSPKESGAQLFIPQGPPFGKELVICEGEFKAMSLCEQGIRAVAIGGVTSAMTDGELIPELDRVIHRYHPRIVYFLGDNDTALNHDFAREAVKLRKALPKETILKLPRTSLSTPKGIDDIIEELGRDKFPAFWEETITRAIVVEAKMDTDTLALRLLSSEWDMIRKDKDHYLPLLTALGGKLRSASGLDELARKVKAAFSINTSAFKADATRRNYDDASEASLPDFYFDGNAYYKPAANGFDRISREDASLALRSMGFRHRLVSNCELTPCEVALHRLQSEHRVDYSGPICGRPAGLWREKDVRILSTRGPNIIHPKEGDASPIEMLLGSLLGDGRDQFFDQQYLTFCGWIARGRQALKHPEQHLPGQAVALVGPRDCGKSLLQSLITHMLGGREADPALWLVKGNDFNGPLWGAEHLRLGDEELIEDSRDRHALRDRMKKMVTADVFSLHRKHQDANDFRPIWRVSISCNDDGGSLAVLPPLSDDFADKIIYLKCYPPTNQYHDGSTEGAREFWQRLLGAIPAFLYQIETLPLPEQYRKSRFYVREFHHPDIVELIAGASPVGPLGELITRWLSETGGEIEGATSEIYEGLRAWYSQALSGKLTDYSKSPGAFVHQLRRLSELPGWEERIRRSERRIGENRQRQTVYKITSG